MIIMIDLSRLKFNRKGQAAITDALFFLTIIITLAVLLFRYSSTYGDRIEQGISDLYFKEYTNSAMKTIFFTSVPLSYDLNLEGTKETDYLMTSVKEDYFTDKKIGTDEVNELNIVANNYGNIAKYNLYNTIKSIMYPLESYDYLFYLYNSQELIFDFFLIKITNYEDNEGAYVSRYEKSYNINQDEPYSYYLCKPNNYTAVRDSISVANKIFSSSIPLNFYTADVITDNIQMTSTFAIWPSTVDINDAVLIDPNSGLNCIKIEDNN